MDKLHIKKGEFVSIIGKLGSGKSSIIAAILGEIDKISGNFGMRGTTAFVPQESWLRTATVRENILFEEEYDEERY